MKFNLSRQLLTVSALAVLTACSSGRPLDWDLRGLVGGGLDTSSAALQATGRRPAPDARGVISYPDYQVVVASRGDTVNSIAARLGISADALGRTNAIKPTDPLRAGEVLALPDRVATTSAPLGAGPASGAIATGTIAPSAVEVTTLAGGALDRATGGAPAQATQPGRHRVARGETAYTIARLYNVSPKALGEWNAINPDAGLREGQYLLIPTPAAAAPVAKPAEPLTNPGQGTPTPVPPSAATPLPQEKTQPAAAPTANLPKSPELGRTTTGRGGAFAMPVRGSIIRAYAKGRNDGIDIAAAAGTPVAAAADGTVAAITKDTDQVPILVIRHADNLLSVYAGIDGLKVAKGDAVKRGQAIAVVRKADPAFLHFEIRKGVNSIDPQTMLQ